MIMTVVTENGALAAAAVGDLRASEIAKRSRKAGEFWAGMTAGPNQKILVVEVPDRFTGAVADPSGLMAELGALLKQRGLL